MLSRSDDNAQAIVLMGAEPVPGDVFDVASLEEAFAGADAVVNLATHVPGGYSGLRPGAWRTDDALRTRGVSNVIDASRLAGVRRIVQESHSYVYADHDDHWITETAALDITPATEPVAVGESHVQAYACDSRTGVVLRFGTIVGDDPITRFWMKAAAHGRPTGIGRPTNWTHLIHTDDLGSAVAAALYAPSGVYNVGAEPVRRCDQAEIYAAVAGGPEASFLGPVSRRMVGSRLEPLTRSQRVSSDAFTAATGWRPSRPVFDASWLEGQLVGGPVHD